MDEVEVSRLVQDILDEISLPQGGVDTDRFSGLREVDAKVREFRTLLSAIPDRGVAILTQMDEDHDFGANSRRVRLEALANYCRMTQKFIGTSVMKTKKTILKYPDLSALTSIMPGLEAVLERRWVEAQKCQHFGSHLSAVILMGSILEGLLLARASLDQPAAYSAKSAPSRKDGSKPRLQEWSLSNLIDVAAELGWIKSDRRGFSHALRESRNSVHPWQQIQIACEFDEETCKMSWEALKASVKDLLASVGVILGAK